jgi:CheY-like chemotaxis protein
MEHTSRPSIDVTPWGYSSEADRLALPTILLVEDDRDARDMMSSMFEMAGFAVVACDSAEPALDALREQEFDLVLTDYALPRHSGTWLLQTAEAEGLLQGTPALIVTAHPRIDDEEAYEVIRKPFDLDQLVERVRFRLESEKGGRRRTREAAPTDGNHGGAGGNGPASPEPIQLISLCQRELTEGRRRRIADAARSRALQLAQGHCHRMSAARVGELRGRRLLARRSRPAPAGLGANADPGSHHAS